MIAKVDSVHQLKEASERKVFVGGSLVSASMRQAVAPQGYVAQTPRSASSDVLLNLRKLAPKIYVHLSPALFDHPKKRFALAIDAYLAWGMKHRKGLVALIGGISDSDGPCHVDVLVFDNGTLVSLYSNELPDKQSPRFQISAEAIVSKLKADYPVKQNESEIRICLAAPLSDWNIDGVEYLGDKVLGYAKYRPLEKAGAVGRGLLLPAGIVAAGMLINFGIIGVKWGHLGVAESSFDEAYSSPEVKAAGGIDSDYITVMTQRSAFMDSPRRQDVLPEKMLEIGRALRVVPGIKIVELQLPAPGIPTPAAGGATVVSSGGPDNADLITSSRVADAQIKVSVPRVNEPAYQQAKTVISALAASTGMSLRLVQQNGVQDDAEKKRRIFTIEGFIHG